MRSRSITAALGAALLALGSFVACSSGNVKPGRGADAGAKGVDAGLALCAPCVTSAECSRGVCAQVGGDSYCLQACPNGDECGSGSACDPVASVSGDKPSACLSLTDICGTGQAAPAPAPDAGCAAYFAPTSDAGCATCSVDAGHYCQPNGCRHGLYCNMETITCEQAPAACGGTAVSFDGGEGVDGAVSADGGSVSRLYFAVVGDTRPPNLDETAAYPTQIITTIFGDITALRPMPSFIVSTGDYMFASTTGTEQGPQLDAYLAARAKYPGPQFPAMGNHECNGATASNCGVGSFSGVTSNMSAFLARMLAPIGQTSPYYVINVAAPDASWTAKFVFIAANAWSDAQATWLDQALSAPTTYTFVVRHESAATTTTPGVTPSEAIVANHPYTLEIVGHTHSYGHLSAKEVLVGNGGAPLSGGVNYGFGVFGQRASDGAIVVDMIDYQSGLADGSFHFAVKADGSAAPP